MVRILTKQNVNQLLTMADALKYVEEAYKQLTLGQAIVPQRIAITDPAPGLTLVMPGIIGGEMNALATKIVSVYKQNPEKYNMPTVLAKIMVQDINTGDIVGIMDGSLITAMRTGAATGVSVKYLAPEKTIVFPSGEISLPLPGTAVIILNSESIFIESTAPPSEGTEAILPPSHLKNILLPSGLYLGYDVQPWGVT